LRDRLDVICDILCCDTMWSCRCHLHPEDGNMFLQNVGNHLQDHTCSWPRIHNLHLHRHENLNSARLEDGFCETRMQKTIARMTDVCIIGITRETSYNLRVSVRYTPQGVSSEVEFFWVVAPCSQVEFFSSAS
jgi:hypothetical protein